MMVCDAAGSNAILRYPMSTFFLLIQKRRREKAYDGVTRLVESRQRVSPEKQNSPLSFCSSTRERERRHMMV
jgi:hypothetical protein